MTLQSGPRPKALPTPALLVVIHQQSPAHAVRQTMTALEHGADGVFLINHDGPPSDLLRAVAQVRSEIGLEPWVGINPLGLDPLDAVRLAGTLGPFDIDGLWVDNAGLDQRTPPWAFAARQQLLAWGISYFGGVAFKYQEPVANIERAAYAARDLMDYVTTSGPGTGMPIDPDKLEVMAAAAGPRRLAVASGVSAKNIHEQLPHVGAVLVATSVSSTFTELNPAKVQELAHIVSAYREGLV